MKRNELLTSAINRITTSKRRNGNEVAIIKHLPFDLDVTRVFCSETHLKEHSSNQGVIEIEVNTFHDAVGLLNYPELTPVPTSVVIMERPSSGFNSTITFYPDGLVRKSWCTRGQVEPIYPVVFHATPNPGGQTLKVSLEWFIMTEGGLHVSVRVFIREHGCCYQPSNDRGGLKKVVGSPTSGLRRSYRATPEGPEYLTVYWKKDGSSQVTLAEMMMKLGVNADERN